MKKTMKSVLSFILIFALIMGVAPITVAAEGRLAVDKEAYLIAEKITVTVSGLTTEQIEEQGAWLGIFKKGDKANANSLDFHYVESLPNGNTWKIEAPVVLGDYEARLYWKENDEDKLMESIPFAVISNPAKEGDLKIKKDRFLPLEKVTVTITGLTDGQVAHGAWAGVYFVTDKPMANSIEWTSIENLRDGKTWEFKAPTKYGKYEVRIYTLADDNNEEEIRNAALFGKLPFMVASNPAKPGDLKISKTAYNLSEEITVTIIGLTPGQIEDGAWAGVFLPTDKIDASPMEWTSVGNLRDGKNWKFKAPENAGKYEVRVYTQSNDEIEDLELAYFGKLPFTVLNATGSAVTAKTLDWAKHKMTVVPATKLTVVKGKTAKLVVSATPVAGGKAVAANNYVVFKSSNTKVATVDKAGVIKGIAAGTAKITITAGKTVKTITVTVK